MRLLGLSAEPPFHPRSWSGSSSNFFHALLDDNMLADAVHVRLSQSRDRFEKFRAVSWPLERWKERYRVSAPRLRALTELASREIERFSNLTGVIQIGAWFSAGSVSDLPCFGYFDGNAAMAFRHYGRGLLSETCEREHLTWERDVYAKLNGIFVMSSWLASSFRNDFDVPARRIHVVGGGINTGKLPTVPARDFRNARFLFVGKQFARKGGPLLLQAFASLRKRIPRAELTIVGPSLALDQPGVRCVGFLSQAIPEHVAVLRELFETATAVVLPSIYEPFGISLLEGMAFGLPCIAADRCAMPEIVQHRKSGLVVQPEDVGSLADAMIEIAENPADAEAMGRVGRSRVENEFTWTAVARKVKTVLSSCYGL